MTKEEVFKKYKFFSKEDILSSLDKYMEFLSDDSDCSSKNHYSLCKKLYEKIKSTKLPKVTDPWWSYSYLDTGVGYSLVLSYTEDLELSKDESEIDNETIGDELTILNVECEFLSVDEFAKLHGVTNVTVRQWIRRGKLRNSKKIGGEWLIPDISTKPKLRGFEDVVYSFEEDDKPIIEQYPMIQFCDMLYIFQNSENKKVFDCFFTGYKSNYRYELQITRAEVEELELALLASGKAKVCETPCMFVPSKN